LEEDAIHIVMEYAEQGDLYRVILIHNLSINVASEGIET
jgi:hypothetical protein